MIAFVAIEGPNKLSYGKRKTNSLSSLHVHAPGECCTPAEQGNPFSLPWAGVANWGEFWTRCEA